MDDDLNAAKAMAAVFGLVNEAERRLGAADLDSDAAQAGVDFLQEMNSVLGLFRDGDDDVEESQALTSELEELLRQRDEARRSKDWDEADRLRDELATAGIEVRDSPEGSEWSWK